MSHSGRLTVSAVGGSHEEVDVVQVREDEFTGIAVKCPEAGALVHGDLETGRFFEFFSNALNQLGETRPVSGQNRLSVPR
jgi:hypothetical protein